jgi:hypothetical protein
MVFILPPGFVPVAVATALVLGKLPEVLARRRPPGRLLMALGDSWFAVGPALVFAIAAPGAPDGHDWPLYLLALGAQFLCDFTASSLRERLNAGASLTEQLRECRWVYLVDMALAAPALAIAFAAWSRPWMVLLVLPLTTLMAVFARERRARMDYVLELSHAYRGTALLLGDVVEADDEYTGAHSRDVVSLVLGVADRLGLGFEDLDDLQLAVERLLAEASAQRSVRIAFELSPGLVRAHVGPLREAPIAEALQGPPPPPGELGLRRVLETVVDSFGVQEATAGELVVRLDKQVVAR